MVSTVTSAEWPGLRPYIVGVGGTNRAESSTEKALRFALRAAENLGARTALFGSEALDLPMYTPEQAHRVRSAEQFIDEIREADGVILASPAYHGGVSGRVKNAIDYVEELRADTSPYLQGRAVGLIATAAGWQGAIVTLAALRSIVHSLRGWPTPLGVPINTLEPTFDAQGNCILPKLQEHLVEMARQVVEFALNKSQCKSRAKMLEVALASESHGSRS